MNLLAFYFGDQSAQQRLGNSNIVVNRSIKLIVSLFVVAGDVLAKLLPGARKFPGTCVIINYHSISAESKSRFGKQLDILLRLARPVPAAEESLLANGGRYVAITVDDVFQSFYLNGLPELCQRAIPVTLFPPTGYLGRKSSWNDYGGENKIGEEVVSAHDLKQIAGFPNVQFGSHCVSHPDLALLSEKEAMDELQDSKEMLRSIVGQEIISLSFPYGSYGPRELRLAREAGYKFCFTSTPETIFSRLQPGLIGRVDVQPTDWNIEFRLKVLGAYRWIGRASAWKRKYRARFKSSAQVKN